MKILQKQKGFSLIELLVVLAIMALLIGLVGPKVMKQLSGAKADTAQLQIADLGAALDLYFIDNGQYPTSKDGLNALIEAPTSASSWNGPYLKKKNVPLDPWKQTYHYQSPGQQGEYDLYSYGADNLPEGEGDNKDIVSW